MAASYTQKTLAYLRDEGWTPWIVERWLAIPPDMKKITAQLYAAAHGSGRVSIAAVLRILQEALGYRGGKRVDCFNLIDIIAYRDGALIGVQSTGPSGHASHRRAMMENEHLPKLIRAGMEVVLISWRKLLVKRGGKARRWEPRWEVVAI